MSERTRILQRVRGACGHAAPHPGPYRSGVAPSGWDRFVRALRVAGGEAHGPVEPGALGSAVTSLCRARGPGPVRAEPRLAEVLGAGPWESLDPEAGGSDLADTRVYVARGRVGVEENGAVAVELGAGGTRAALFLCEHLVLVLDVSEIEPDLHQGVARLRGLLPPAAGHVWISGPSKTADIEQTLVFGAHGPRTLDLVGVRAPGP